MNRRKFLQLSGGAAATAVGLAAGVKPAVSPPVHVVEGGLHAWLSSHKVSRDLGEAGIDNWLGDYFDEGDGKPPEILWCGDDPRFCPDHKPCYVHRKQDTGPSPFAASHTLTEGNGPSCI